MASSDPKTPLLLKLPDPPAFDFWTPTQWDVLLSLADAALAPVVPESELADKAGQIKLPDAKFDEVLAQTTRALHSSSSSSLSKDLLKRTLAARFSDEPACVGSLKRTVAIMVQPMQRKKIGGVLALMSTRFGALLLTGYCTPVQDQPMHVREAIMRAWQVARLGDLRLLAKSISSFAQNAWVQGSPLFRQATGYLDAPHEWKPGPDFDFGFLQFPPSPSSSQAYAEAASAGTGDGEKLGGGDGGGGAIKVDTDVVIVGSGCGGSVCAKVLAEAGHRVLVVDKGYYFPPSQLPMPQEQGSRLLFENGGVVATADASVNVVAGSTWGGGGTVNWSVSLQTQGFVRREWAQERGLRFFETQDFQDRLDRVCDYMGASRGSEHSVPQSHRGQVLLDGSRRLGWQAGPLPQNSGGADHSCGRCMMGCGSAEKQGPAVSWLPAAARAGASFIEGFTVDHILFGDGASSNSGSKLTATGVVGTWVSRDPDGGVAGPKDQRVVRKVVVTAKKVIVSAGSLWSPLILSKSGVKNRHLGHHLHVHPCNMVGAYYREETKAWEEGIITSYCTSFEDLDGHGHGVKLEPTCQVPYTNLSMLPWRGGLDFKLAAARYGHMDVYISLTRDRDTGSVRPDPTTGQPVIYYTPSAFDRAHTMEGVIAIAKCCYIMGATEIRAFLPGTEPFIRAPAGTGPGSSASGSDDEYVAVKTKATSGGEGKASSDGSGPSRRTSRTSSSSSSSAFSAKLDLGVSDPAFAAWLDSLRRAGNAPPAAPFSSAHQMGTCRMGVSEDDGVVDGRGKVWAAENLFVADASVFPSASGVNPMITNMAIADWIASNVIQELASSVAAATADHATKA